MGMRASRLPLLVALTACGGSAQDGGGAKNEHALVVDSTDERSAEPDTKREDRDSLLKKEHQRCFKETVDKHPKLSVKSYELTLSIRADGSVSKVEVDKSKTEVSDPSFMKCLVARLKQSSLPAPHRELKARLVYPD